MSLETWNEEFYPISAMDVKITKSELYCALHSLKKWIGYRPENLKKHEVTAKDVDYPGARNCALCNLHGFNETDSADCSKCILTEIRGVPCDERLPGQSFKGYYQSPYHSYHRDDNPEPMIELLTQAVQKLLEKEFGLKTFEEKKKVQEIPKFDHDCKSCVYLGSYFHNIHYDLYFCGQGCAHSTVIARFGDDGPDYNSGLNSGLEELIEAERRAKAKGLLQGK